jgi:hypothetical protein
MKQEIIKFGKAKLNSYLLTGIIISILIVGSFFSGCSDTPVDPNGNVNPNETQLSFSTILDAGVTDDPNVTLSITEAKALITNVEIEISDSMKLYKKEMFVINFDVNGNLKTVLTSNVPKGVFKKIKFKVHKPEDFETPPDPEFKTGTSGDQRFSFIVKGTYNGNPFIFKSRKSMNIVLDFATVVNITSSSSNMTMIVDKLKWFTVNGVLVDPSDPTFEDDIDDNIKDSFKKIFKDDDKNGIPDDN